jgi:hypothetical protein
VYLDEQLWRDWTSLRYLVMDSPSLALVDRSTSSPATGGEAWLVVWPYADSLAYAGLLPPEQLISVREGPWEKGDLEDQPRLLCIIYEARPALQAPSNLQARFEREVELLGYQWLTQLNGLGLRLFWRAGAVLDADYSVFVHWRRDGRMMAQSDTYPAQGYYPTRLWRPGDIVVDDHLLKASTATGEGDSISVGLYSLQTMKRLKVLDRTGAAVADHVTIEPP